MRHSRYLWKLYASYVVLIVVSTGIVGGLIARQIKKDTLDETRGSLRARATLLRDVVLPELSGGHGPDLQERVRALGSGIATRLTVIRLDGQVLADSEEDPTRMDNHSRRPEILAARTSGQGTVIRFSDTLSSSMMYLALPVRHGGKTLGFVRASVFLSTIDDRMTHLRSTVFLGAGIAAFVALVLGFLMARAFATPLASMTAVAASMSKGDYGQRLPDGRKDEIGQLARALNQMAQELARLETMRRDFVGNVSHELKTPITAIRGLTETLLDDEGMDSETRIRFLSRIAAQSLRLSSLVSDLLTISRLEAPNTVFRSVRTDLNEVVRAATRSLLPERGQDIQIHIELGDEPLEVLGDAEALRQVATNLLDNAIKCTPAGGEVWLRLQARAGHAVLEVEDSGIGIEAEHLSRIFERFYRVDTARSRELGGTGLGLSIVKHIALSHGGEVCVESTPGQGSLFRVRIPLAADAPSCDTQ